MCYGTLPALALTSCCSAQRPNISFGGCFCHVLSDSGGRSPCVPVRIRALQHSTCHRYVHVLTVNVQDVMISKVSYFTRALALVTILLPTERERVTCSNMASTMINILVNNPIANLLDFSSLRVMSCGGSPLSPATYQKAISMFGCEFFISYGAAIRRVVHASYSPASQWCVLTRSDSWLPNSLARHDRMLWKDQHVHGWP